MSSATTEAACLRIPLAAYPGFNRFTLDWIAGCPFARNAVLNLKAASLQFGFDCSLYSRDCPNWPTGLFIKVKLTNALDRYHCDHCGGPPLLEPKAATESFR